MPTSITRKLLFASRQSYLVTATGPVPAGADDDAIGWLTPPAGFASGADKIDAGMVGETETEIIVAFRGTLRPDSPDHEQSLLDWLNDADALLLPKPEFPGMVHQGFLGALDALWPAMEKEVAERSAAHPAKPVYVTGHSKGGAVANLCAYRLRAMLPAPVSVLVATFAAAKPGNDGFQAGYDAKVTHSIRYECQDDIVPHLPPSDLFFQAMREIPQLASAFGGLTIGFAGVGTLQFINWSEQIVGNSIPLRLKRMASLAELLVTLDYKTIIADHAIDPGSVYGRAPYP